ncbi:hypothetical protein [Streptomyces sp. TE33382]
MGPPRSARRGHLEPDTRVVERVVRRFAAWLSGTVCAFRGFVMGRGSTLAVARPRFPGRSSVVTGQGMDL